MTACRLLTESRLPVTRIAEQLGFSETSAFTRPSAAMRARVTPGCGPLSSIDRRKGSIVVIGQVLRRSRVTLQAAPRATASRVSRSLGTGIRLNPNVKATS